jgi:hypothetical protein
MSTSERITPSDLVLYRSRKGVVKVGVLVRESGELEASATVSKMEMVQHEGAREVTRALEARLKAEAEYDTFRVRQDREFVSDFGRIVEDARRLGEEAKPVTGASRKGKKP